MAFARSTTLPAISGWPADFPYLLEYEWAPTIQSDIRQRYVGWCAFADEDEIDRKSVSRSEGHLCVREITDQGHPARGEGGLFAARQIKQFQFIVDYVGVIRLTSEIPANLTYTLSFHGNLSVDASIRGNEGRFINDWHGIASRPNAAFDTYRDVETGQVRVGAFSLNRTIEPGEEIVVPYGAEFWGAKGDTRAWDPSWDEGEEEAFS
ncbi:uncharacterized protein EV422DRAFT_359422 [Fimicolochytrium jonesii]|uniref:uncharacterized protein n=1 Tax=Fimicolochytrium jonesii TaxID=1396493 RepID=UPI0022FE1BA1|nr:uncharacterized protein EV422DRAFT_359422 [Fimicolochytrium jonesii]KAI8823538.1 hypothetical protein EV422DRAFT_359422 [Fimicolochytrium jonesii]